MIPVGVGEDINDRVHQFWRDWQLAISPITEGLFAQFGSRVLSGPFKGMDVAVYAAPIWCDGNVPQKLIGNYEFELHAALRKAVSRKPDCVINAGCAEGYYAVGLARLLPDAEVYAMDMETRSLDLCEQNARRNCIYGHRFILVGGKIGPQDLSRGRGRKLYVMDIEGYELSVLDPSRCADLASADIIVECHDFFLPEDHESITEQLRKRFAPTHEVERIDPSCPDPNDYPFLHELPYGVMLMSISERRPERTAWLACWAKC